MEKQIAMKHMNAKRRMLKPDQELTEIEAVAYARQHGFTILVSRLQQSRAGRCRGPKYIKKDGFHIRYTPRFLDEYIEANKPQIIDPAARMAEVS